MENANFIVYDDILSDYDKTRLIQSLCTKTRNFDIPDTAIAYDQGAFCRHTHMAEIPAVIMMK